jgi:ribosomal-protein-alanine N-acetyltransferase
MPSSSRLRYEPLSIAALDRFHALVTDDHIRRYLMDGELFPREWSEERINDSTRLFERRGVGLSLAYDTATGKLVGFCGFLELGTAGPEPQLVYALLGRFTGHGYATEMARAAIADARGNAGFTTIVAAVDEVNSASMRVLEKLGFERTATQPGAFGNMFTYTLR